MTNRQSRKYLWLIAASLASPLGSPCQAKGPSEAERTFASMDHALRAIASSKGVFIGIEVAQSEEETMPIRLDLAKKDVRALLNDAVRQRRSYAYKYQSGVYLVYPREERNKLVDLRVRAYEVKEVNLMQASAAISRLPEFQNWLTDAHLQRREFQVGASWKPKLKLSLALKNVPLHVVFNELVKSFGLNYWIVSRYGDDTEYIAIYFYRI